MSQHALSDPRHRRRRAHQPAAAPVVAPLASAALAEDTTMLVPKSPLVFFHGQAENGALICKTTPPTIAPEDYVLSLIPEGETELRRAVELAAAEAAQPVAEYLFVFLLAKLRAEFSSSHGADVPPPSPATSSGEGARQDSMNALNAVATP